MPTGRPCTLQLTVGEATVLRDLARNKLAELAKKDTRDRAAMNAAAAEERSAAAVALRDRLDVRARYATRLRGLADRAQRALDYAKTREATDGTRHATR